MNRIYLFMSIVLLLTVLSSLAPCAQPSFPERAFDVLHYDLSLRIGFEHSGYEISENTLSGVAKISLKNTSGKGITEIPILLHRLMKATAVLDGAGRAVQFSQTIRGLEGRDTYQVNYVEVHLRRALSPGGVAEIEVDYEGHLTGYAETGMLYVRESLDPAFTIIRSETFAYPHILFPVDDQRRLCWNDTFDQTIHVTVPKGYVALNSGEIAEEPSEPTPQGFITYHFTSTTPRGAVIIPIAKYERMDSQANRIYYFPEDRSGAETVSQSMEKACGLFTGWFGPLKGSRGISVVEIPADFGSQSDYPMILQTAAAFQKATELGQLYHELSHLWNPKELEVVSPRWNEGLAMFLQGLVTERLGKDGASLVLTEHLFSSFQHYLRENKQAQTVPMMDYGIKDLTSSLSYTGGEVFFALVYDLLGPDKFFEMYRTFYDEFGDKGATTEDLLKHLAGYQDARVDSVIHDWFRTADYAVLTLSAGTYQDVAAHYRTGSAKPVQSK